MFSLWLCFFHFKSLFTVTLKAFLLVSFKCSSPIIRLLQLSQCSSLHLHLLKDNSQSSDHNNMIFKLFCIFKLSSTEFNSEDDNLKLQKDLEILFSWTKDWILSFNESNEKRCIVTMSTERQSAKQRVKKTLR